MRALPFGLLLFLCITGPALAAPFPVATQRASDVAAFVPERWKIEQRVTGDLNGDGRKDVVLVLVQDEETEGDRERALVVALRDGDGYEVAATNAGMLAFVGGLGVRGGNASPDVKLRRGVLSVGQYGGSRTWYDVIHRFKWNAKTRALELVGRTDRAGDRLVGSASERTCDFLTGACVERVTAKQGARPRVARSQTKTSRDTPLEKLEDVTRDE